MDRKSSKINLTAPEPKLLIYEKANISAWKIATINDYIIDMQCINY